ncbi:MAG: O-methyltransferase [Bacteroidaceae bacterium]|nr:O-methyltransferase [Bacteroidaceae bacterium]
MQKPRKLEASNSKGIGYTGEDVLEQYIKDHIEPEGDLLYSLYRETNIRLLNPRMASGHIQGRLLKMLTGMIRPRTVLEIGTFTGYSAICIAQGLEDGAMLHTIEVDDELQDFIESWLSRSGLHDRISLHIGDATEIVPQLGLQFDMIFMDGEKRQYPEYYEMCMSHLAPGGYILADNTLWDGHVADAAYDRDSQTVAIRRFNDMVAADSRVTVAMIPIRDGITLIRKNL